LHSKTSANLHQEKEIQTEASGLPTKLMFLTQRKLPIVGDVIAVVRKEKTTFSNYNWQCA
jgi:hypothetical protein